MENKFKKAMSGISENQVYINSDGTRKDSMVPNPPKKGELMHCQWCGKVMRPKDFSKDPETRKKEFKWQIHWPCREEMLNGLDMYTPGLVASRHDMFKLINEYKEREQKKRGK